MHAPTPPKSPGRISSGAWWGIGLALCGAGLSIAAVVSVLTPSHSSGAGWDVGLGGPSPGHHAGASGAFDSAALTALVTDLEAAFPDGSDLRSLYVDGSGYGFVDACDADSESLIATIEDWTIYSVDPGEEACPGLLGFDEVDPDTVAAALENADSGSGTVVDLTVGDVWGLVEPADEPYIVVTLESGDIFVYSIDGQLYEHITGYGGGGMLAFDSSTAASAIQEIVSAADLVTASAICGDSYLGQYTIVGHPVNDSATTQEWINDGAPWQLDEWPRSGPEPLTVDVLDLPNAIERIDELRSQWQHDFPVSLVCVEVVSGETYEVSYSGFAAGVEHTVVTDPTGVILRQS